MATLDELERFHGFAAHRLNNGGAGHTLEELLTQWRADLEREKVNAGIREGLADVKAGRSEPVDDFLAEFRAARGYEPLV